MLRKKEVYTNITPIPSHIPRQLAVDILHSHSEIITLNPLVLDHKPVKAPRDAQADEFYSTWYEITERIQYVPGMGRMGSGKISFKGCFHDMPWGLQTHILAPLNIDMRNNWRIAGNQPGEPPEQRELGLAAPAEGLYLREDIEIKCNITMVSFVKSQMKAASKVLVDRLIKKAELLDAGVLQAMMENGRLKTYNPADRSDTSGSALGHYPLSPRFAPLSPRLTYQPPMSPTQQAYRPSTANSQQLYPPASYAQPAPSPPMELPGDYCHPGTTTTTSNNTTYDPSHLQPHSPKSNRNSSSSSTDGTPAHRWSDHHRDSAASTRPTSYNSEPGVAFRSPAPDQKSFTAELPTMAEAPREHDGIPIAHAPEVDARGGLGLKGAVEPGLYKYNPQDFADVPPGGGPRYTYA